MPRLLPSLLVLLLPTVAVGQSEPSPARPQTPTTTLVTPEENFDLFRPEPLTGTISTDRPSFGTGTRAVPIGRFQAEIGYLFADDEGRIHRRPAWAQFQNGQPVAIADPLPTGGPTT